MKALSLWQPWASAVALGLKVYETRSWRTHYFGPIAIHAAKRIDRVMLRQIEYLKYLNLKALEDPPTGAIIATAILVECIDAARIRDQLSHVELHFGDFSDGRWAWRLREVRALPVPIPFRGRQGLFDIPDELLRQP